MLTESLLIWSCSLRVTGYPHCALLAFSGTRTRLIAAVEGAVRPARLLQVGIAAFSLLFTIFQWKGQVKLWIRQGKLRMGCAHRPTGRPAKDGGPLEELTSGTVAGQVLRQAVDQHSGHLAVEQADAHERVSIPLLAAPGRTSSMPRLQGSQTAPASPPEMQLGQAATCMLFEL